MDWSPFFITVKVGLTATAITCVLGIAVAYMVSKLKRIGILFDCIFSLPLVLPPTVVGFYLLVFFGRRSEVGSFLMRHGIDIVFDIKGAIIASVVVAFPLMYRASIGAIRQVDKNTVMAARTLGMSEGKILVKIILPMALPGIMAGLILSFARTMGEFGATIMLAGNIPGRTQTVAVAIYTAVAGGDRNLAYKWTFVMLIISFLSIILLNLFEKRVYEQKG